MLVIDVERFAAKGGQKFDLGAEKKSRRIAEEIERLLAEAVATQKQRAVGFVQDREGPHPLAAIETIGPELDQRPQQDFGIAFGLEPLTQGLEFPPQLHVVVKLAVVNQNLRADAEGLIGPILEIDDRKPRVKEHSLAAGRSGKPVRRGRVRTAAMHRAQSIVRRARGAEVRCRSSPRFRTSDRYSTSPSEIASSS